MAGRAPRITEATFRNAALKAKSVKDMDVATILGVNRSNVFRWKAKPENAQIVAEVIQLLSTKMNFGQNKVPLEAFRLIPSIIEWEELMIRRPVIERGRNARIRSLWYVCNHLHIHPDNLTIDQVADHVFEMKALSDSGQPVPKGLAYTSTRVAIRSFFTLVLGLSGELLAAKGVDAAETKGAGQAATQTVSQVERRRFEATLRKEIHRKYGHPKRPFGYAELLYEEVLYFCKFMYYTGSRKQAVLNIMFEDPKHNLAANIWSLHILDKGKKGGKHWQKMLIEKALDDFRGFVAKRHKLPLADIESEFRRRRGYLFPLMREENGFVQSIKVALRNAGSPYF